MLPSALPTMEVLESNEIAHMVYNYLLEVRLLEVAKMFFESSPHLTQEKQLQIDQIPSNNPIRRISQVMHDFNDLQQQMRKLIWKYGKNVQFPPRISVWEKVKYLVDHLHTCQMTASTTNATLCNATRVESAVNFTQSSGSLSLNSNENIDIIVPAENSNWEQTISSTYAYQDGYDCSNEQLQENRIVYHVNTDGTLTLPTGEVVVRETEEPLRMCYVIDENGNGIQVTSNILLTAGRAEESPRTNEIHHSEEQNKPQATVIDESQMEVGQQVEIGSIETERHPSQQHPNQEEKQPVAEPTNSTINRSEPPYTSHVPQETPKPVNEMQTSVPLLEQGNFENISIVANLPVPVVAGTQEAQPEVSTEPTKPTEQSPSVKPNNNEVGLAEWNRIRAINKTNFDNYAREVNYMTEIKERLEKVLQKKQSRSQRTMSAKAKTVIKKRQREEVSQQKEKLTVVKSTQPAVKVKATVRVTEAVEKFKNNDSQMERKKNLMTSTSCDLSDSSDSVFSLEDDESIRQMTENVKRYRRQRIDQSILLASAKRPEHTEIPAEQSVSTYISSITPKNPVKRSADSSPPKPPATLRKNTSKSVRNVRTPAKAKQQPLISTARAGTARQQQLRAKKLAEAAETEKEDKVNETPQLIQAAALSLGVIDTPVKANTVTVETSPTENRRPARSCASTRRSNEEPVNRKPKANEKNPKKQTSPRKRAVPIEEQTTTADSTTLKPNVPVVNGATDNYLESPPPASGEVAEAAIYAVLAQLHGD